MDIDRDDLDWAVRQDILSDDQAEHLWAALQERTSADGETAWYDPSTLAYYAGALLVIVAMGWFAVRASEAFGPLVLAATTLGYGVVFAGVGGWLRARTAFQVAGGLLVVVAVAMVAPTLYGLERGTGLWQALYQVGQSVGLLPAPAAHDWTQADLVRRLQDNWAFEEVATVIAGLVALRYVRFPFLSAPVAFALWHMATFSVPQLLGAQWSRTTELGVSAAIGAVTIVGAYVADRRGWPNDAFWGYLFGLVAFWSSLTLMDSGSEWAYLGYFGVNIILVLLSLLLRRRMFLVFGALGILLYLEHLADAVFAGSMLYPVALSVVGIALIYAGVKYQQRREAIGRWVRARLPRSLRRLTPPRNPH